MASYGSLCHFLSLMRKIQFIQFVYISTMYFWCIYIDKDDFFLIIYYPGLTVTFADNKHCWFENLASSLCLKTYVCKK